ncbi:MAG: (2Fe-2S) ferredoxin domain-containing protein, partial [Coprobacillus sp.]
MERIQVLVCAGTGCTIGDSGSLIEAFESEIKSLGLEKEVSVLRTGCLGLCGVGPNVSIYPDNIIYKT